MDGENRYAAEGLGLQDAKKGVIFESFPPVLHLQLKRFEYDMVRDQMVKVRFLSRPCLADRRGRSTTATSSRTRST